MKTGLDWFFMYLLWYKHAIQSELLNYSESYESFETYLFEISFFYYSIIDSFILPLYMHIDHMVYFIYEVWNKQNNREMIWCKSNNKKSP